MTEFDLTVTKDGLVFEPVRVEFKAYQHILDQAETLRNYLEQSEVTEDNIKEAKRLVASVRKQVNALDQERIQAKREAMKEFEEFEAQVKLINQVVTAGEDIVRGQIKELEQVQRNQKEDKIREMWETHAGRYEFTNWYGFDEWFEPRFSNKSQSLNKTEENMIDWLEAKRQDIQVIDAHEGREELMDIYRMYQGNLAQTLTEYSRRQEAKKEMKKEKRVEDRVTPIEYLYSITLTSKAEYEKLVKFAEAENMTFDSDIKMKR